MGATAEVDFRVTFPPLINDKDEIEFTGDVAAGLVGEQNVDRMSNRITASRISPICRISFLVAT